MSAVDQACPEHCLKSPKINLATCFTFIRIFVSPVFLLVYLEHDALGISQYILPYVLLFLLMVSELSDAFDGYFARKYNQVTDLGKILDPMADSISRISVFLTFTQPPVNIPLALVFIFLYRDSVVSTLRTICALKGFALAARKSGKLKAVFQALCAVTVTSLLIPHSLGMLSDDSLRQISTLLIFFAAIYTVYSACDYIMANRMYIFQVISQPTSHGKWDELKMKLKAVKKDASFRHKAFLSSFKKNNQS